MTNVNKDIVRVPTNNLITNLKENTKFIKTIIFMEPIDMFHVEKDT